MRVLEWPTILFPEAQWAERMAALSCLSVSPRASPQHSTRTNLNLKAGASEAKSWAAAVPFPFLSFPSQAVQVVPQIHGLVKGDLIITGIILLGNESQVTGNLKSGTLVIEEGAKFAGSCDMSNSNNIEK